MTSSSRHMTSKLCVVILLAFIVFAVPLLGLLAACSSSPGPGAATPVQFGGPDVSAVIVTTDHAVGPNRVVFGLVDRDGMPVRVQEAMVQGVYVPTELQNLELSGEGLGTEEVRAEGVARFQRWPVGRQGVLVAGLTLDRPGFWKLKVSATTGEGREVSAEGAFQVKDKADTPAVGDPAPSSVTPTVDDVGGVQNLATITSANPPDPGFYRHSIHTALESGKPLVVAFSTPAFCTTATCGPQLQSIAELKEKYREQANFIHVEVFQDPHLIEGGRPTGNTVAAVSEWNLPTEPWTFVVDGSGIVRAKFEQFTTAEEIEAALLQTLQPG